MDTNFKFELGSEVKDIISGFTGLVFSRSQWLYQCNTYGIKPKGLKDGKPIDTCWFDEPSLELIKKEKEIEPKKKRINGSPEKAIPQTNRF